MKQIFFVVIFLASLVFSGCKTKNAKDLIVNKWKFMEISGTGAAEIPDSIKKMLYATSEMEFSAAGSFIATGGMRKEPGKGTYKLSDDGNTLYSYAEGKEVPDTLSILELTKDKLVVFQKTADVKLTMMPK